jgi:hypothetical protein
MSLLDHIRIAELRAAPIPDDAHLLDDGRIIGRARDFSVVYGPFSTEPNLQAEVIFVGLTPGRFQLELASRVAREQMTLSTEQRDLVMRRDVAFAGSMRRNLVAMLDALGLQRHLGLQSTADLFAEQSSRAFTTSALLYPVFRTGWKNYSGDGAILKEPLFLEMLKTLLGPLLAAMPQALIIPFGRRACESVLYVAECELINAVRVLRGFPHPSGANGHRRPIFEKNAKSMQAHLTKWFAARSGVGTRGK